MIKTNKSNKTKRSLNERKREIQENLERLETKGKEIFKISRKDPSYFSTRLLELKSAPLSSTTALEMATSQMNQKIKDRIKGTSYRNRQKAEIQLLAAMETWYLVDSLLEIIK